MKEYPLKSQFHQELIFFSSIKQEKLGVGSGGEFPHLPRQRGALSQLLALTFMCDLNFPESVPSFLK